MFCSATNKINQCPLKINWKNKTPNTSQHFIFLFPCKEIMADRGSIVFSFSKMNWSLLDTNVQNLHLCNPPSLYILPFAKKRAIQTSLLSSVQQGSSNSACTSGGIWNIQQDWMRHLFTRFIHSQTGRHIGISTCRQNDKVQKHSSQTILFPRTR